MKRRFVFLVLLAAAISVRAEDVPGMAAFLKEVTAACERQDAAQLQTLQYEAGVTAEMLKADRARATWQSLFDRQQGSDCRFSVATFTSLQDLKLKGWPLPDESKASVFNASDSLTALIIERATKPFAIEGKLYKYNLNVLGVVGIFFSDNHGQGFPVGVDPAGRVRFALLRPVEKEASPRP